MIRQTDLDSWSPSLLKLQAKNAYFVLRYQTFAILFFVFFDKTIYDNKFKLEQHLIL